MLLSVASQRPWGIPPCWYQLSGLSGTHGQVLFPAPWTPTLLCFLCAGLQCQLKGGSVGTVPAWSPGPHVGLPRVTICCCPVQTRIEELQGLKVQVWRTRKGVYRKKHFPDVRDVQDLNTGDGLRWKCCDEQWKEKQELTIHLCWTLLQWSFFLSVGVVFHRLTVVYEHSGWSCFVFSGLCFWFGSCCVCLVCLVPPHPVLPFA